mmetsp:Transcript_74471/g.215242  ORF Transcript_74471/g.215242 Transcript_74471/m.215242 type:complete len:206 (+) Transcript_74471:392-1009(+)
MCIVLRVTIRLATIICKNILGQSFCSHDSRIGGFNFCSCIVQQDNICLATIIYINFLTVNRSFRIRDRWIRAFNLCQCFVQRGDICLATIICNNLLSQSFIIQDRIGDFKCFESIDICLATICKNFLSQSFLFHERRICDFNVKFFQRIALRNNICLVTNICSNFPSPRFGVLASVLIDRIVDLRNFFRTASLLERINLGHRREQ